MKSIHFQGFSFKIGLLFYLLCFPIVSQADLGGRMERIFSDMGFAANVGGGGAYKDQMGGFMSPGSMYARAPVSDTRLMSFQAPSFNWGCGGIDIFGGAFSYISKEQFVEMVRNIGSNAMSYAVGLALAEVTPQIKDVIDDLQSKMQAMNNLNINSCQAAAHLVGGLAPKTEASSGLYCSSKGLATGVFKDWADAKHGCKEGDRRRDVEANRPGVDEEVILGQDKFLISECSCHL